MAAEVEAVEVVPLLLLLLVDHCVLLFYRL